jgi:tellurite resistance protein TehA-like permease
MISPNDELENLFLIVFLFFTPIALGSWYMVISDHIREKKGLHKRERYIVMAVFTAIAAVTATLYLFGLNDFSAGLFWLFFVVPTYCIELGVFLFMSVYKKAKEQLQTEEVNSTQQGGT